MPGIRRKRRAKGRGRVAPQGPANLDTDRGERPPPDPEAHRRAESVEDPLDDWLDDEDERLLRERGGADIEKPEDQT